jgi:hypothetical protein
MRVNKVFTLLVIVATIIIVAINLTNQARQEKTNINKNTTETAANFTCPMGYIRVPGNSLYQTKDFCVMKYEAKTGSPTGGGLEIVNGEYVYNEVKTESITAASTTQAGTPQVKISQTNAITACSLNGAGYGLINNVEWMTIARNIEAQDSNWYNPTTTPTENKVGSGGLWRGHSDGSPNNALEASTDDNPYFGTGNDINNGWQEKRTHTLSNGEVIWDLSGNVFEWTSDNAIRNKPTPTGSSEFTAIKKYGALSYDLIRPSNPEWNSAQNMGKYGSGGPFLGGPFAFLRGGYWFDTNGAGVFTLSFDTAPGAMITYIGFRCVLR